MVSLGSPKKKEKVQKRTYSIQEVAETEERPGQHYLLKPKNEKKHNTMHTEMKIDPDEADEIEELRWLTPRKGAGKM